MKYFYSITMSYPYHTYKMFREYPQQAYSIPRGYRWYIYSQPLTYQQYIYSKSITYLKHTHRIPLAHPQYTDSILIAHFQSKCRVHEIVATSLLSQFTLLLRPSHQFSADAVDSLFFTISASATSSITFQQACSVLSLLLGYYYICHCDRCRKHLF